MLEIFVVPLVVPTTTNVVPESAAGRVFRDTLGLLNQGLAAAADEVYLVAAGLPLRLKGD